MEKNAKDIYGDIYTLIKRIQNSPQEEYSKLMPELFLVNEHVYSELESYDEQYAKLRDKNIDMEEKIKSLNSLLDERMAGVSPDDMLLSGLECERIYADFWSKLDEYSKKYLNMANYLYKLFINEDKDFSPSILEFGRAVENELLVKIYKGFIADLSGNTSQMIDSGSFYGELKKAVKDYNNNGEYYIPARAMVKYLKYLPDETITNQYNDAFKGYLDENCIDRNKVSEVDFTTKADVIFDEYRNRAAHPGGIMNESKVLECSEMSGCVLKTFMSAINN